MTVTVATPEQIEIVNDRAPSMRGPTLLKRVTMTSGTRQTVALPRQRKGRWAISVRYRRSVAFTASSRTVYLRVR